MRSSDAAPMTALEPASATATRNATRRPHVRNIHDDGSEMSAVPRRKTPIVDVAATVEPPTDVAAFGPKHASSVDIVETIAQQKARPNRSTYCRVSIAAIRTQKGTRALLPPLGNCFCAVSAARAPASGPVEGAGLSAWVANQTAIGALRRTTVCTRQRVLRGVGESGDGDYGSVVLERAVM